MTKQAVVDIEANGLLDDVDTVHCVVVRPVGGRPLVFHDHPEEFDRDGALADVPEELYKYDQLIAHNGIGYDEAVFVMLLGVDPAWIRGRIFDTQARAMVIWPDIKQSDFPRAKKGLMPGKYIGQHALEAWGYRLRSIPRLSGMRILKDEYTGGFEELNQEMIDYCIQDTLVTEILAEVIQKKNYSPAAFKIEDPFASIIARVPWWGFHFNADLAFQVLGELRAEYDKLYLECEAMFPATKHVYKRPPTSGKHKGMPYKMIPFNPNSPTQVAAMFCKHLGWKPGKKGSSVDDAVLRSLPFPEAEKILTLRAMGKRIGNIDRGEKSWMANLRPDGRVPSVIRHNGTQTSRCTHRIIVNVPKPKVRFGELLRSLFDVPPGKLLVGCDAKSLEARCLANALYPYDGGNYAEVVLSGNIHRLTMATIGVDDYDVAKTFFYALVYGAMDPKLGSIIGGGRAGGAKARAAMMEGIPGWAELMHEVLSDFASGYSRAIDGRLTPMRSQHAALNTRLQRDGALVMKVATVRFERLVTEAGLTFFDWHIPREETDVAIVTHQHDEIQSEVREQHAPLVAELACQAIAEAGVILKFHLPLEGDSSIGTNWSETH